MPAEADPTRTAMTDSEAATEARRIITDFATAYRDQTPVPHVGTAPPVQQPGRPAMSSRATDDSVRMIAFGGMTLMMSAGGGILMVASDFADPTVIGMICAAPTAVAIPILALARLAGRARDAVPAEIHNHYSGTVVQDQRETHTSNRGAWVKNINQQ